MNHRGLTRREFTALSGTALLAACTRDGGLLDPPMPSPGGPLADVAGPLADAAGAIVSSGSTEVLRLKLGDPSMWTVDGGQAPIFAPTVVLFADASAADISGLLVQSPYAAAGSAVDLVATLQVTPQVPNGVDAGFQLAINDGASANSAVLACLLIGGVPHLGLVSNGNRDELGAYPAVVLADWITQPITARLRRTAEGGAELVEINAQALEPRPSLPPGWLAPPTRAGTTFEFGCFSGPAILNAQVTELYVETVAPAAIPFGRFQARADIVLRSGANDDRFDVEALLAPGAGSDGFDPLTEAVTLRLGPASWTIPAGSFRRQRLGWFSWLGTLGLTRLSLSLVPLGRDWLFVALGSGAELSGVTNPVRLGLTIGDDAGEGDVTARILA